MIRFLSIGFALLATFLPMASGEEFPSSVTLPGLPEAMATYCFECHDSASSEADIDLEFLESGELDPYLANNLLESIHRVVAAGDMPPRDAEQPTEKERTAMLSWLDERTAELAATFRDDPGPVVAARLTKRQYRNVLADLTGGIVTDAGAYLPDEGGAGEGFDNVGAAQNMSAVQVEKFLEAARNSLRHLRANPADGFDWRADPRADVVDPAAARQEAINDLIDWFSGQQNHWAFDHTDELANRHGTGHGPYLAAAWTYHHREALGRSDATMAELVSEFDPALGVVVAEKWYAILSDEDPVPPWTGWAKAWQSLPAPDSIGDLPLLDRCNAIVTGRDPNAKPPVDDFAPAYELSFREGAAREETIRSAKEDKIWPFEIEIGEARELFLVVTSAGDGNRGDKAIWQAGLFHFPDGSTRPWHSETKIRGANSGNIFQWGRYHDGGTPLRADGFGVTPPGALKIEVPEGAERLTVELAVDRQQTQAASIQALILKEKPSGRMQSHYPGRLVFGGKSGQAVPEEKGKELDRGLRRVNLSVVGQTKRGLNAERNVLADWDRFDPAWLGGPWEDQPADEENDQAPYYLTVPQILRCASPEDLAERERLLDRLEAAAQVPHQQLQDTLTRKHQAETPEGVVPKRFTELPEAEAVALVEAAWAEKTRRDLAPFARRAWRRPVSDAELDSLLELYRAARADGLSYDASVKQSLLAVLASPNFLYTRPFVTGSGSGTTEPLDSLALASRLSFLVWNSVPDDALLSVAEDGSLSDPATVRKQLQRLLADDRSRAMAESFAGQLFGFVGFEEFTGPDPERFPGFTPALRDSMLEEAVRFCHHLLRGAGPLTDLIDARYSFLDATLGAHYGVVGGLPREGFEKVGLPEDRGGLPGMALFLTRTSEPLRTSPVQRGTWILETILGTELANPPANVPAISQDETDETGLGVREQLEVHRADATCASCHDKIDPLGIALEGYDPIGRRRDALLDGTPPDPVATTHDGVALDGAVSLRAYLKSSEDEVMEHFIRKLLGYSLGRSVGPGDRDLLERLAKEFPETDHHFPWLLEEIVKSQQFLHRRRTDS